MLLLVKYYCKPNIKNFFELIYVLNIWFRKTVLTYGSGEIFTQFTIS